MRSYDFKRCTCRTRRIHGPVRLHPAVVRQLKLASVPSTLNILLFLERAPHCVCDLMAHTRLSQTLISHHLAGLAGAGLVQREKRGAFIDYSLTAKGRKLIGAIRSIPS